MGVVYRARQPGLNRLVALKMILHADHAGDDERQRFQREAQVLARLRHEHIVQVYEVGEHEGKPFLSLELIEGGSLSERLRSGPLTAMEAAVMLEQLARAMQVAHDAGVIHRDLKPANILLAACGLAVPASTHSAESAKPQAAIPKVTDFGLARNLGETGQTQSGDVLGTPSYMAPEQARGKAYAVDARADVYALGAILYECLTGRPPFRAATVMETLQQVLTQDAVAPSRLQPSVPRDLETICLKCLEKEPERRYLSARDLAEDMRRFQAGEAIVARPVGPLGRAVKWAKRRPLAAAFLTFIAISLSAGIVGTTWAVGKVQSEDRISKERDRAEQNEGLALDAKGRAEEATVKVQEAQQELRKEAEMNRRLRANLSIGAAENAWNELAPTMALKELSEVPGPLRHWEWHYRQRRYQGSLFALPPQKQAVTAAAFTPDGQGLITASLDGTVSRWHARTGEWQSSFSVPLASKQEVALSVDGRRLLCLNKRNVAQLWDVQKRKSLREFDAGPGSEVIPGGFVNLAFSPDGTQAGVYCKDAQIRVWDVETGALRGTLAAGAAGYHAFAFSSNGQKLVFANISTIQSWDLREMRLLKSVVPEQQQSPASLALSPDDRWLVVGYMLGMAEIRDPATLRLVCKARMDRFQVTGLDFRPDGQVLASGGLEGTIKLWDVSAWKEAAEPSPALTFKGALTVARVAFRPDGHFLASGHRDGTVKIWNAQRRSGDVVDVGVTDVSGIAFSPNNRHLAACDRHEGTLVVWDALQARPVFKDRLRDVELRSLTFSPDGGLLAVGAMPRGNRAQPEDWRLRLYDVRDGRFVRSLGGHAGGVAAVACSWYRSSRLLASAGQDRTIRLWNIDTGAQVGELKGHENSVMGLAFNETGTRLASACEQGRIKVWDVEARRELLAINQRISVPAPWGNFPFAFSRDGDWIATRASSFSQVQIWNARTGAAEFILDGHQGGEIFALAFTSDRKRLASAGSEGNLRLWDLETRRELLSLRDHEAGVLSAAFSPDEHWLVTGGYDGKARLHNAQPLLSLDAPLTADEKQYRASRTVRDPAYHLREGSRAESEGRFVGAAAHYGQVLFDQPWDAGLHILRAEVLTREKQTALAAVHYLNAALWRPAGPFRVSAFTAPREGEEAARAGDWTRASGAFAFALGQPGAMAQDAYALLLVQRMAKQEEAARRTFTEMLRRYGGPPAPAVHFLLLGGGAVPCSPEEGRRLVQLSELQVQLNRNLWSLHWHGVALYRAGRHADAVSVLEDSIKFKGAIVPPETLLILAMAQRRLHKIDEARQNLSKAEEQAKKTVSQSWQEAARMSLLLREAKEVIEGKP